MTPAKKQPIAKKTAKKQTKPQEASLESRFSGNLLAAHRLIAHLARGGYLGLEDMVLVEALYTLARQVDESPDAALLWRQYLNVNQELKKKVVNDVDDALESLLGELRGEVGHT